ncbi:MAG TPA: hypothetical protein VHD31_00520 [Candidatus Paceibacterota bacterium]|nr:hypothetical protein [Candidatus Paceibacterota bacterium]
MRWGSSIKNKFLSSTAKALLCLATLLLVFSSIGATPKAQGASVITQAQIDAINARNQANSEAQACVNNGGNQAACEKQAAEAHGLSANSVTTNTAPLCNSISSCLLLPVYAFTVGFGSFVAYVAAYIFNVATQLSINSTAYGLTFVTHGWETARDIANMGFILILIYIAITIILSADTGHTMQTLAFVIFIALIINFSFFFTRVVIDAGNIVAAQFYNAVPTVIVNGQPATVNGTKDLTASIMNAVGVQKILGTDSFGKFQDNTNGVTEFITLLIIYIFMGVIYFILAAAFVSVGIRFIVRIAVLWLIIVASPLAFIAKASHRFEKYYDQWQETLISHAFYPAVFLFIFWLIVQFAGDLNISQAFVTYIQQPTGAATGVAGATNGLLGIAALIADISIRLGFIIVMLFLGMKAADGMGAIGAQAGNWAGGKVGFAIPARFYRNTVGRVAYEASRSERFQGVATSNPRTIGRIFDYTNRIGKGSLDLRNPLGKVGLTEFGKAGGKGGIAKAIDEAAKGYQKQAEAYKGDAVDVAREQRRFEREYDEENGRGEYEKKVGGLKDELKEARRDAIKFAALAAKSTGATADSYRESAKVSKKLAEDKEKEIKSLTEVGSSRVSLRQKENLEKLAARLNSRLSRAQTLGAEKVLKMAKGGGAHDNLLKAVKQFEKDHHEEEGGGEEDHDKEEGHDKESHSPNNDDSKKSDGHDAFGHSKPAH